jgi:hypothetical protein
VGLDAIAIEANTARKPFPLRAADPGEKWSQERFGEYLKCRPVKVPQTVRFVRLCRADGTVAEWKSVNYVPDGSC